MKKLSFLFFVFLCLNLVKANAQEISKAVSGRVFCEVPITSVDKVETIKDVIGESPLSSEITLRISGSYETAGNINKDSVLSVVFERNSTGGYPMNNLTMKLYVVSTDPENKTVNCLGNISSEKAFEADVKFKPSGWSMGGNTFYEGAQKAEVWTLFFGPRADKKTGQGIKYSPNVSATLNFTEKVKKWTVSSFLKLP